MKRTDYGELFLSTGGLMMGGAAVCLFAGTIGVGGFVAAAGATYVVLVIVNAMDKADR
jgi:hypothetical protein